MAVAIYFPVIGMSAEKYSAVIGELEAAGAGAPAGRSFHCGFNTPDGIRVFDVWESQEAFDAFGETLLPILASHDVDPGDPMVAEVERIIS